MALHKLRFGVLAGRILSERFQHRNMEYNRLGQDNTTKRRRICAAHRVGCGSGSRRCPSQRIGMGGSEISRYWDIAFCGGSEGIAWWVIAIGGIICGGFVDGKGRVGMGGMRKCDSEFVWVCLFCHGNGAILAQLGLYGPLITPVIITPPLR